MNYFIKEIVRHILFYFKKKRYKIKIYCGSKLTPVREISDKELFYGYYDKSPEHNGKILFHEMNDGFVNIIVKDISTGRENVIAKSKAYNWQLGTRAMWINDDNIVYNDFEDGKYVSRLFSLSEGLIVKTFPKAIQDYSTQGFFLGVNYQRLRSYAKEYGYYCLPELSEKEFNDYEHDGIWKIDSKTGEYILLLSIQQVMNCDKEDRFDKGKHFVNHVMISPDGDSFIFIHRYYVGKERYDRLMYYDFKELKCIMKEKHQSHYCWLDNSVVFGYGEYQKKWGFHKINVLDGTVEKCDKLTKIHPKDGHPTVHGDWIVVDSYPYLDRMQILSAYNFSSNKYVDILELFHDLKHKGYDRCDLHPRFSKDGGRVFLDTIYLGKRMLCFIDVSNIIE